MKKNLIMTLDDQELADSLMNTNEEKINKLKQELEKTMQKYI